MEALRKARHRAGCNSMWGHLAGRHRCREKRCQDGCVSYGANDTRWEHSEPRRWEEMEALREVPLSVPQRLTLRPLLEATLLQEEVMPTRTRSPRGSRVMNPATTAERVFPPAAPGAQAVIYPAILTTLQVESPATLKAQQVIPPPSTRRRPKAPTTISQLILTL
jgi:hypothetical protein